MPGPRVASGERVTLRTAEREDVPFLQRADANPELRTVVGETVKSHPRVEDAFEEQWGFDEMFLVRLDGEDAGPGDPDEEDVRRIGFIGTGGRGRGRPDLGMFLVPAVQGEGYGGEALSPVVDHVFRTYHHPAVEADTFAHNEAARGLLESLGFTQEGRIRRAEFWDGAYRDKVDYGLLRSEWCGGDHPE